ncbi:Alpha/Beta hydrolase protein [Mycena rosella]|uniref:Alpha/Beta hydrolase protein n=1 Tax=Mycena rosella TaxID=1033263 RepID=A0AAD7DYC9_MYCRO|nr:Alpha/Beta hydrolase protein [Mycena rosella]
MDVSRIHRKHPPKCCPSRPIHCGPGNIVNTGYATYRGNLSFPDTVAYLGIPYAEPPLGPLRFRAPLQLNTTRVAVAARGAVVDATEYPNFCVQGALGAGDAGGAGSEDCLKVNIYAPAGAKVGSNRYVFGNPRSPNVVVVTVYYRLNAFGFLSVPEFSDPAHGDFNAGFSDQTQALRWAVTVNGESAGGASVELHLCYAQSVYRTPLATPAQVLPQFQLFAFKAGCGTGPVSAQLACLRTARASAIVAAQDFCGYSQFHPVLDGKIFTDFPTRQISRGNSRMFLSWLAAAALVAASFSSLPISCTSLMLPQEYPMAEFASPDLQSQAATGEPELLCARHILGSAASKRNIAWTYRYNQPNPTSGFPAVGHAAENWMMFLGSNTGFNGSVTFSPMTPVETSFAEELIAYWLSFARVGNPNTFKLARSPLWPQFTATVKTRMVLQQDRLSTTTQSGSFLEIQSALESQRCNFIASQVGQLQVGTKAQALPCLGRTSLASGL